MRAREFVITIPINLKIYDGVDEPKIQVNVMDDSDDNSQPRFVPPLQQQIELQKADIGKRSTTISHLISNDEEPKKSNKKTQKKARKAKGG